MTIKYNLSIKIEDGKEISKTIMFEEGKNIDFDEAYNLLYDLYQRGEEYISEKQNEIIKNKIDGGLE